MSLNVTAVLDAIVSHAAALGLFERVNTHELKSAPGHGLHVEVWNDRGGPAPARAGSGLASTSALLVFHLRIRSNMLADPQDEIDPHIVAAVDALIAAYSADFTLGGAVRTIDLLGMAGTPLSWQAGYVQQDSAMYRVVTLTVPVIVNDAWPQLP